MTDWMNNGVQTNFSNEQPPEKQVKWNPNIPYVPPTMQPLSPKDEILRKAVDKAIKNGWQGWRFHVNDAVTVGYEADALVRNMIRAHKPIEPLIFNKDFAKALWPDDYLLRLQFMVIADDYIKYLADNT